MYKLDTHVHTAQTSPCGRLPAEVVVKKYKAAGYGGIVMTDHYNKYMFDDSVSWDKNADKFLKGYRAAKKCGDELGLDVFLGLELRFEENDNDYLVFGMTEDMIYKYKNLHKMSPREFRSFADKHGLAFIQAHPFRSWVVPVGTITHGCEVFNGHFCHNNNNETAEKYAEYMGFLKTSGSDCHYSEDAANGGIILKTAPTTAALAEIIKSGDYDLIKTEQQHSRALYIHDVGFDDTKKLAAIFDDCKSRSFEVVLLNGINGGCGKKQLEAVKQLLEKQGKPYLAACENENADFDSVFEKNFITVGRCTFLRFCKNEVNNEVLQNNAVTVIEPKNAENADEIEKFCKDNYVTLLLKGGIRRIGLYANTPIYTAENADAARSDYLVLEINGGRISAEEHLA